MRRRSPHVRAPLSSHHHSLTPQNSWEAILYWLYTGVIVFAPLSSAGRAARTAAVAQHAAAHPDRPRPVSCKSVYRIADAVSRHPRSAW